MKKQPALGVSEQSHVERPVRTESAPPKIAKPPKPEISETELQEKVTAILTDPKAVVARAQTKRDADVVIENEDGSRVVAEVKKRGRGRPPREDRVDKIFVGFYAPRSVHKKLRVLAAVEDREIQELLIEGVNRLLAARNLPAIAELDE